jgi:transposase InsO family protein
MSESFDNEKQGQAGSERGRSPSSDPAGEPEIRWAMPPEASLPGGLPPVPRRRRRPGLRTSDLCPRPTFTPEQRLLVLDSWRRSGLSATDFAPLVGLSRLTLYHWKKRFETLGPGGLVDRPRGAPRGSKLPDLTRRTILMLKESNPEWGCQRISDMLFRSPGLPASPQAVANILREEGYQLEEAPTRPHEPPVRNFERARPNQLWQSDLFTFVLKRQNRRVYLVAFLDDHSRFVVGHGLHGSQSALLVLEVLRSAISSYQAPVEVLTDNGTQYVTWRGKSVFTKELEKRGIRQVVATPRHPETLGKIERFWGSLWRECLETAVFLDLADAQRRIAHYIDHYNFQRPHQGIGGLVPADRFFGAAPEVLKTLKDRVASNALELARSGIPRAPFYLTGQVGGRAISIHAEGERVVLHRGEGREEVDLTDPAAARVEIEPLPPAPFPEPVSPGIVLEDKAGSEEPPAPGVSPLDEALKRLEGLHEGKPEEGGVS